MTMERTKVSRSNLSQKQMIDIQSEKIEMTLNTESSVASGLLIQRLTELYENPIEASVRETVSNGLDAIAIGYSGDRPEIRIEKPSRINPIISIADNGPGMSYEDLKNVYAKYGASTKQNNFDQVGAYGLGAKSPLAYGTQFTVSSVNEGIKTVIIVAREEMTNYIKVISSVETDEPSGTIVSIPVNSNDIDKFSSVVELYRANPADYDADLYIDGQLIDNDSKEWKVILDNVEISENVSVRIWANNLETFVQRACTQTGLKDMFENIEFVIGGWVYKNPNSNGFWRRGGEKNAIVELKPGFVSFNSSRDAILNNERLISLINSIKEYPSKESFQSDFKESIEKLSPKSFDEALSQAFKFFSEYLEIQDYKLKINFMNTQNTLKSVSEILIKTKMNGSKFSIEEIPSHLDPSFKKGRSFFIEKGMYTYKTLFGGYKGYLNSNLLRKHSGYTLKQIARMNEEISMKNDDYYLTSILLDIKFKNNEILVITDIPEEEMDKTYNYVIRKREEITNEIGISTANTRAYSLDIHMFSGKKEDFIKMLNNASIENANLVFLNIKDFKEKQKKEEQPKEKRKVERNLNNVRLNKYHKNGDMLRLSESDLPGKKNVFVLIENNVSLQEYYKTKIWYANKNNLKLEDVELIMVNKSILAVELEILSNYGEIFLHNFNVSVRDSKVSRSVIKGVAGRNIIYKLGENKRISAFVSLLEKLLSLDAKNILYKIDEVMDNATLLAQDVGVKLDKTKYNKLINSIEKHMNAEEYVYSRMINEKELSMLLSNLKEEDLDLLETLSFILSTNRRSDYYSIEEEDIVLLNKTPELSVILPDFHVYEAYKLDTNKNILKFEQEILKAKLNVFNDVLTMIENFSKED